jgi:hypothetical protein
MEYPEEKNLNERSIKAIELFHEIAQGAREHGWTVIFLSGFAFDAHLGHLTRNHKDVDVMVPKEYMPELRRYLTSRGHELYEIDKDECIKVDHADPEKSGQTFADLHYCWEEAGRVVIPLKGKKLVFSGGFSEIAEQLSFLGETILVLKPEFLAEEKMGWKEQIGLPQPPERVAQHEEDMEKVRYIVSRRDR